MFLLINIYLDNSIIVWNDFVIDKFFGLMFNDNL